MVRQMQPTDRAALGFMCKDIIDFGRLKWLESQGLKSHLVKYVPFSISPENNLLVAGTWQRRDIATSEVSFFLCCGSFLMFLKTDLQFLFRLKFNLNFILKKNSIYWELLIYYRREIIKIIELTDFTRKIKSLPSLLILFKLRYKLLRSIKYTIGFKGVDML